MLTDLENRSMTACLHGSPCQQEKLQDKVQEHMQKDWYLAMLTRDSLHICTRPVGAAACNCTNLSLDDISFIC